MVLAGEYGRLSVEDGDDIKQNSIGNQQKITLHYLEEHSDIKLVDTYYPIHNDSAVIALSEIAAMAFAGELTGLPYSPYVMDVFLVYGYSPEEASGLYEEMMELAGRKPCAPISS